jgi:hypothetical protein
LVAPREPIKVLYHSFLSPVKEKIYHKEYVQMETESRDVGIKQIEERMVELGKQRDAIDELVSTLYGRYKKKVGVKRDEEGCWITYTGKYERYCN